MLTYKVNTHFLPFGTRGAVPERTHRLGSRPTHLRAGASPISELPAWSVPGTASTYQCLDVAPHAVQTKGNDPQQRSTQRDDPVERVGETVRHEDEVR